MREDENGAEWKRVASPSDAASLDAHEVHLWLVSLDAPALPASRWMTWLDPDERERAARMHFARDRHRQAASRALLRSVLGRYVGAPPQDLRFRHGPQGKPFIDTVQGLAAVEFNMSHSAGWAVIGVCRRGAIGVDLEAHRDISDWLDIARGNFTQDECSALLATPAQRRGDAFFACWTRKEAVVKALGGGLSVPLDSFEVSVEPDAPARLRSIDGSSDAADGWSLWGLQPLPNVTAAVAVSAAPLTLHLYRLG